MEYAAIEKDNEKKIQYAFRTTLIDTMSYMQSRLSISNYVLRDLQCLYPLARKAVKAKALHEIMYALTQGHKD